MFDLLFLYLVGATPRGHRHSLLYFSALHDSIMYDVCVCVCVCVYAPTCVWVIVHFV